MGTDVSGWLYGEPGDAEDVLKITPFAEQVEKPGLNVSEQYFRLLPPAGPYAERCARIRRPWAVLQTNRTDVPVAGAKAAYASVVEFAKNSSVKDTLLHAKKVLDKNYPYHQIDFERLLLVDDDIDGDTLKKNVADALDTLQAVLRSTPAPDASAAVERRKDRFALETALVLALEARQALETESRGGVGKERVTISRRFPYGVESLIHPREAQRQATALVALLVDGRCLDPRTKGSWWEETKESEGRRRALLLMRGRDRFGDRFGEALLTNAEEVLAQRVRSRAALRMLALVIAPSLDFELARVRSVAAPGNDAVRDSLDERSLSIQAAHSSSPGDEAIYLVVKTDCLDDGGQPFEDPGMCGQAVGARLIVCALPGAALLNDRKIRIEKVSCRPLCDECRSLKISADAGIDPYPAGCSVFALRLHALLEAVASHPGNFVSCVEEYTARVVSRLVEKLTIADVFENMGRSRLSRILGVQDTFALNISARFTIGESLRAAMIAYAAGLVAATKTVHGDDVDAEPPLCWLELESARRACRNAEKLFQKGAPDDPLTLAQRYSISREPRPDRKGEKLLAGKLDGASSLGTAMRSVAETNTTLFGVMDGGFSISNPDVAADLLLFHIPSRDKRRAELASQLWRHGFRMLSEIAYVERHKQRDGEKRRSTRPGAYVHAGCFAQALNLKTHALRERHGTNWSRRFGVSAKGWPASGGSNLLTDMLLDVNEDAIANA